MSTAVRSRIALVVLVAALASALAAALGGAARSRTAHADDPVQQLAARHAPELRLRVQPDPCGPGEPYRPIPAEGVLDRDGVTLRSPDGMVDRPGEDDLGLPGAGEHLDYPGNALRPGCTYERLFDAWRTDPVIYARVATDPEHPEVLVLQYWFFYLYNDWNDRHEGDWEMIQLHFPASSADEALRTSPSLVAYAQHEGAEVSDWESDVLQVVDGTHPVVYVAAGSHASYFGSHRWFGKSAQSGFGCDDTRAPVEGLRPAVMVLDDASLPRWARFEGRWGEEQASFNNGPTGPITKRQWSEPVRWVEEEGRRGAVALPEGGTAVTDAFCSLTGHASTLLFRLLDDPWTTVIGVAAAIAGLVVVVRRTRWWPATATPLALRRDVGQMATSAIAVVRRRPLPFVVAGLLLPVAGALGAGLQAILLGWTELGDLADVADRGAVSGGLVALLLGGLVVGPIGSVVSVTVMVIARRIDAGLPTTPRAVARDVWAARRAVLVSFVAVTALVFTTTTVLLPVGLVLMARWAVAVPASLDSAHPLRRSAALTRGRRVRAFGVAALTVTMSTVVPMATGIAALLITEWSFDVVNLIAAVMATLLVPASAVVSLLQYHDLRERQDLRHVRG